MQSILYAASLTLISIHGIYLPSSYFVVPLLRSKYLSAPNVLRSMLFVYSFVLILFALLDSLGSRIDTVEILRSSVILLTVPLGLIQTQYYCNRMLEAGDILFLEKGLVLPLFISLSFSIPILVYEPSSLGRLYVSLFILLFAVPFSFGFIRPKLFFKSALSGSLIFALSLSLYQSSTTLFGLLLISSIGSCILTFSVGFVEFISSSDLLVRKSSLKFIATAIIFSFLAVYIAFSVLDTRRISNFTFLIESVVNINFDKLLSLGGGRYYSNFSAYYLAFVNPFSFSGFMQDLPSVIQGTDSFSNLLSRSGLDYEFIASRRPNALIAWLCFNLRIFSFPYIFLFFLSVVSIIRNAFFLNGAIKRFFYFFSLVAGLYFALIASPNSFYAPLMILLSLYYLGSSVRASTA